MFSLSGKTAYITWGSSDIGRGVAEIFVANGANGADLQEDLAMIYSTLISSVSWESSTVSLRVISSRNPEFRPREGPFV